MAGWKLLVGSAILQWVTVGGGLGDGRLETAGRYCYTAGVQNASVAELDSQ
jgi:hypothetical protein